MHCICIAFALKVNTHSCLVWWHIQGAKGFERFLEQTCTQSLDGPPVHVPEPLLTVMHADMQEFRAASTDADRASAATGILTTITSATVSALELGCD
jgi:hypothetical protein